MHFLVEKAMVSNCVITACKSSAQGGAVAGIYDKPPKGVCIDCLFHGNNYTANKGMVGYLTTFKNCVFSNNVTAVAANGNYVGSVTQSCRNYDCLFIYNQAEGCGGARGGVSVNCRFLFNSGLNPAGNNWANPGGGAARDAVLTNCYFYGNVAYRLGGAIRGGKVVGCTVESNTVAYASDSHGGGIYGATLVESSTIVSNLVTKRGGGLANCSGVTNCYIAFNAAYGTSTTQGGGLSACGTITNCVVEYNMCKTGEGGGGMYDTGAHGSIFRFNGGEHFTKDSAACSFTDCEFVGSCLRGPELMDRCRMHHMSNQVDLVDNVKYGPCRRSFSYAIVNARTIRNCLFDHAWITNGANNAIFYAGGAIPMRVENCSFVSNVTYMTLRGYSASDRTAAFVNCLMTGNRRGNTIYDVTGYQSSYTVFTNCWIGYKDIAQNAAMTNSALNIMGRTWKPRFTGDADHPCSPKLRAPYVGKGLVMDWMSDATDLRGNPRLRDGLVDVGAYQCWLNPDATTIILR